MRGESVEERIDRLTRWASIAPEIRVDDVEWLASQVGTGEREYRVEVWVNDAWLVDPAGTFFSLERANARLATWGTAKARVVQRPATWTPVEEEH